MKNSFKTKCFIILLTACFSQTSLAEQTIPTTTAHLLDKNKTLLLSSAKKGDIDAQFLLANHILNGHAIQGISRETAQKWRDNALAKYSPNAMLYYGRELEEAGEYEKAFQLYQDFANHGVNQAHGHLGRLYYRGLGVKQDWAKAREHFFSSDLSSHVSVVQFDYAELLWKMGEVSRATSAMATAALQFHPQARNELAQYLQFWYQKERYEQPFERTMWYTSQIFSAEMGLDFRLEPFTAPLAYQWSVIYEYGLGVPKNLVVAQALLLYGEKVKIYQMDNKVSLFVPPLSHLDNLSEAELSVAQTLADKMWAISQDKNPEKYIPKQSKILALLKEYTQ